MKKFLPPLAERMRPRQIEDFVGQAHLIGEGKPLSRILKSENVPSIIFWGPPGVGKTTLANLIALNSGMEFYTLSAINAGVKDVRAVIDQARESGKALLFIDEIHRFNKSQQDALLGAVEKGIITLIGATTENPSFEVISALLSRSQVYVLKELLKDDLIALVEKALKTDEVLKTKKITVKDYDALLRLSGGDARKLLNLLELVVQAHAGNKIEITNERVVNISQQNLAKYDKSGEQHYDIISAFIKSLRGSDPNAAVYWLARMIKGGEDPKFIARRMLIFSSEDIGMANPTALIVANNCFQAVNVIGYPECRIILSQAAVYLASSPKSNASYMAIEEALEMVDRTGDLPVPLAIRNAPTKLLKELNYGKDYKYAHDFANNFVNLEYLPEKLQGRKFYDPGDNPRENEVRGRLKKLWDKKYGY